ncbi:PTS IIA-like nitrogen regulatory protein PtsN [Litorimonas sp. RW-G-Af-16]|uniref:PTS IIA-like nitrogen regulatory protein PtsN n=1 Tax=Litorimonas sp. RW-G-Af-16 TaxID=3241168 RepID=UPI00390C77F0
MSNVSLFRPGGVLCGLRASSKKQLFQEIATTLIGLDGSPAKDITCRDIVAAAMERERLGSTGVGNGVALPHARIAGLTEIMALFVRLDEPIDFDAIDDRPVDLVVFLLAPEDAGGSHLRALAKVSRLMRRKDMRQRLRSAPTAEALYTIIAEQQATTSAA